MNFSTINGRVLTAGQILVLQVKITHHRSLCTDQPETNMTFRVMRLLFTMITSSSYCSRKASVKAGGAVTLYAMNLNHDRSVTIQTSLRSANILAYNLEPADGTLTSRLVNNNGQLLKLNGDQLPQILPRWSRQIILKPLTFGFSVIVDAYAKACL